MDEKTIARFWSKVDRGPECWLWLGTCNWAGYGQFSLSRRIRSAHRVAWFLTHGSWPTLNLLHHCDVPRCVRPDHLFEGTQADNLADMTNKGRRRGNPPRGRRHWKAKLTETDIVRIRELFDTLEQVEIARLFNVQPACINKIVLRKTWRHI